MVVGIKRLGTIFVAVGVVFLLTGLLVVPAWAQTDQYEGDQNVSEDGSCPGAEVVQTIEDTGITQGPPFTIEGDLFRITSDVAATEGPDFLVFQVFVQDENGDFVALITQEEEGTKSSFVNEGPGEFFLDINAANAEYTITVEDCVGEDGEQPPPEELEEPPKNEEIINTPPKPLPKTGGPSLLGIALFVLAGAGLSVTILRRRS